MDGLTIANQLRVMALFSFGGIALVLVFVLCVLLIWLGTMTRGIK